MKKISVRRLLFVIGMGASMSAAAIIITLYSLTGEIIVVLCGLLLTAILFLWGAIFLIYFQKKLTDFTDRLCQTLDGMMDGGERPVVDYESETLLARISHRLERLYSVMQVNRSRVEEEKFQLQSLVSDLSHQTKTPIANLKMINDTLLTRNMTKEKQYEFLQAMGSQLDKLDFFIQAMVKTSRMETGMIILEKKTTAISDTLAAALNGILAPMEKKQITLTVSCPEDLTISHDSRWTSEALFNLLDNAVKYTSAYGSIHVSVQEWEMYLKIEIADTGRGIPESEQAAIFKRFYREKTVHDVDGIGIGLYLVREIITMQGGYIKVNSETGKGSAFSVFLPQN